MLIAYVTTDEVNKDVATKLGSESGVTVCPLRLDEIGLVDRFDAMIYDLDFVPAPWRTAILSQLLARSAFALRAVHSYNLVEDDEEELRQCGVLVFRRLESAVFRRLIRAWEAVRIAYSQHRSEKESIEMRARHEPSPAKTIITP
jgi:hypothetical protein